MKLLRRAR